TPSGYKWKPKSRKENVNPNLVEIVLFIVESGCSKHMMGNLKLLINFVKKFLGTIKFRNDQIAPILGYEDLVQGAVTIKRNDIVVGLPKLKFVKDHLCSSCELGKAKRKSFHTKLIPSSKRQLQLLYMDLCGPMRVASINRKRYVLVIVDDYSRYTWTHFLRSKDETPEVLIDFLRLVQRGLQAQVRVVRTDKSTEFLNQSLHAYFAKEGILHQTSVARTPEQNGVVERRNRILVEAARTMLTAAKVPLFFWAEAIATTCFTQNRSLVIPRHDKTPCHIINDRKPSVKFFHIFGSICYIVRDGENLDKMKEKGDECIFVGYSTQSRAYRVFNKRTRVIMESIHVNFDKLPQMAPDQISFDPAPECQSIALNHDNLSPANQCQANVPQADRTVTTLNELDLLFRYARKEGVDFEESFAPVARLEAATSSQAWLWHRRLSHLNFDTINLLSKNDIVVGLLKLKFVKDHICSSCELGKAKRKSFYVKLTPSSKRRLQLLHMDLCGLMRVAGLQAQVRVVRTDKGTKFLNQTLHAYFTAEGIQHQTFVAQTPEKNGVVERRNRTLVEAAQTMLSAAKKPSVKFFYIFGSVCYIVRDGENLDKMKEKGNECIFVGYSNQSRAYRVFNKRTRVIMESIHVNFDELPHMVSAHNSFDPAPTCQTMASDQISSDPASECQTMALEHDSLSPGRKCQENVSHGDKTDTTSNELDLLFSPMFDELLNGSSKVVSKSSFVSPADAPNERHQPTTPLNTPTTPAPTYQTKYHRMVGALMYLTASRPDIMHATCYCARYQAQPTGKHLTMVKRIFRYLKDTIHMGLWYPKDTSFELTAFSDSDHAGCLDSRKSTSGGIQFIGGDKLVSWSSKKQDCTSMSSAEAEYVSLSACCAQVLWMRTQLPDYGFHFDKKPMYCDSKAAIAISYNPVQHSRRKV
nr:retrovirus-related Pol polyprotein from transposon TNT 1-94 [Tanacetum cinerariifolium]